MCRPVFDLVMVMQTVSLETLIDVDTLPVKGPFRGSLACSAEECRLLSDRFGFINIGNVRAELRIDRVGPDTWDVTGRMSAEVVQPCIATGEPVAETVDFAIEERYVRAASDVEEVVVGPEDSEPLVDGCIDLGEIVAQSLALGVSSWPRRADAPDHFEAGDTGQAHPFAKLGSLKATDK